MNPTSGSGLGSTSSLRYQGRRRLGVYCYAEGGLLQHYRVCDADLCRTVGSALDERDDESGDAGSA